MSLCVHVWPLLLQLYLRNLTGGAVSLVVAAAAVTPERKTNE